MTTPSNDILAVVLDNNFIKVTPPQETDTDDVKSIKEFILACLYRRGMDREFMEDMQTWLNELTPEMVSRFKGEHYQ